MFDLIRQLGAPWECLHVKEQKTDAMNNCAFFKTRCRETHRVQAFTYTVTACETTIL